MIKKYFPIIQSNLKSTPWLVLQQLRRRFPLDYWFGKGGYSFFPDQVTFIITKKCNFNCDKCSSNSPQITGRLRVDENFRRSYQELTTEEYKNIIDQLAGFYHPSIYFCGGEPTLRPDLFELIQYAKKKNLITAMTTNGSLLTDAVIKKVFTSGLDFISLSIDGPKDYHNFYRGYPQAFEKACLALKKIVTYKHKYKSKKPNIKITSIIDPEKVKNSHYILKLANHLKINEVAFGNLMFYMPKTEASQKKLKNQLIYMGEYMIGLRVADDFQFKNPNYKAIEKLYRKAAKIYPNLNIIFNPGKFDPKNFYNAQKFPKLSPCPSTFFTATISPTGDLYHCQEYFIGNLRQKSFKELWNDPKIRAFRMIKKKVQMPACYRCLEGQEIKF